MKKIEITAKDVEKAERQIEKLRNEIDYTTRDYSIEYIVEKFRNGEFFIPDEYQRQYIWGDNEKNRFIESLFLGLPIPFMFFSDSDDGRCEIIDGAQRTQTIEAFVNGDVVLNDLEKLNTLNGFKYEDIPLYYRKKFDKTNIRVIVLSDDTTLEIRQEIFNRINTGGRVAKPIEVRRGTYRGKFMDFLTECSKDERFRRLCPVGSAMEKRYERLELVLRFFAYLNRYDEFKHSVDEFLDKYVKDNSDNFDKKTMKREFVRMLRFVEKYFVYGFAKKAGAKSTPRVRFEAIAVGVALALRENQKLVPKSMEWLQSNEFKKQTTTHASNSPKRLKDRIFYVKNALQTGG